MGVVSRRWVCDEHPRSAHCCDKVADWWQTRWPLAWSTAINTATVVTARVLLRGRRLVHVVMTRFFRRRQVPWRPTSNSDEKLPGRS